jgi:integrase/recombinase XerD
MITNTNKLKPSVTDIIFSSTFDYDLPHTILLDNSMYSELMYIVAGDEDEKGNYNFMKLSNIGMIYIFVHLKGTTRKQSTKIDYIRELVSFLKYSNKIGKMDIRDLARSEIELFQTYMEDRYPKSTTRSKKIGIVQSFLEWCYEEEYTSKNLTRGLIPVRINKEEIPEREFDDEVLQRAIMYYNHHPKLKSIFMILCTTGLRLSEVIIPQWGALYYDSKRNRYYLRTITKRGKVRHANIKDYVLEVLFEYRRRLGLSTKIDSNDLSPFYPNRLKKHYSLSSLSSSLSKKMEEAGLVTRQNARSTPHGFRHYFAQAAFAAGAPVSFIAETLGHSNDRTTKENYLRNSLKKENDVSEYVDLYLPKE